VIFLISIGYEMFDGWRGVNLNKRDEDVLVSLEEGTQLVDAVDVEDAEEDANDEDVPNLHHTSGKKACQAYGIDLISFAKLSDRKLYYCNTVKLRYNELGYNEHIEHTWLV